VQTIKRWGFMSLNRKCFFGGTILMTISLILWSIINIRVLEYVDTAQISVAGLIVSIGLLLSPVRRKLSNKGHPLRDSVLFTLTIIILLGTAFLSLSTFEYTKILIISNLYISIGFIVFFVVFLLQDSK
jgi:hypothetical protein